MNELTYTFSPIASNHIGRFSVKGQIFNNWGSVTYIFTVEVYNEKPVFGKVPNNFVMMQDISENI